MNLVTGRELQFYHDQCNARECHLIEETDTEYEQEQERKHLGFAKKHRLRKRRT